MPYRDPAAKRANDAARYERDGERMRAAATTRYAEKGEVIRAERMLKRTPEVKSKNAAAERERYRVLRAEMLSTYGARCSCCGEDEPVFLELDHVNDDGAAHRREIGRGSKRTYTHLKRLGWPKDGHRLLCANCNQGRARNGGVCPHETARLQDE